jgi:hypothetical protein
VISELPLIFTLQEINGNSSSECQNNNTVWWVLIQIVLYIIGFVVLGVKLRKARDGFWLLKEFKQIGDITNMR